MSDVKFTVNEQRVICSALAAYASETAHNVRGCDYQPCAPQCPNCAPKVEHVAAVRAALQQRLDLIRDALYKLDGGT